MAALEQQAPHLKNNQVWNGIKGKKPEEITEYAANLAKSAGILS
jgi:hypothetical protein